MKTIWKTNKSIKNNKITLYDIRLFIISLIEIHTLKIIAAILLAFGLLTLFLSGSVIFDFLGIREREGNYVLFIVWANFISSLIYLVSAYGFALAKKWTTLLLFSSVLILFGSFIGLLVYVNAGGIHEAKTIGAMIFRTVVTSVFTGLSYFLITKNDGN